MKSSSLRLPARGPRRRRSRVSSAWQLPELTNKTTQQIDTRALRTQLINELTEQKMEAVPLATASQTDLNEHAKELGCDYLLMAQITELKASKPGRIGRLVKKTAGESTEKEVTEAKLSVQLLPVGAAKPKMSATTEGNDGGVGFKTGLRLARVAALMYLRYEPAGRDELDADDEHGRHGDDQQPHADADAGRRCDGHRPVA